MYLHMKSQTFFFFYIFLTFLFSFNFFLSDFTFGFAKKALPIEALFDIEICHLFDIDFDRQRIPYFSYT